MTIKAMREVMTRLYQDEHTTDIEYDDSYEKCWDAIKTLCNVGLLPEKIRNELIKLDHELFTASDAN